MKGLPRFDECYVLVLDKRLQDFRMSVLPRLREHGILPKLFIAGDGDASDVMYDHIDLKSSPPRFENSINYTSWYADNNSAYNAHLCHKEIMRKALDYGADTLLLLEDDVFVEDDIVQILSECDDFFEENEWDCLYLG